LRGSYAIEKERQEGKGSLHNEREKGSYFERNRK
jgi:hypothetical protein